MSAKFEFVGPGNPVSTLANAISAEAYDWAGEMKMSPMDVCIAMANACGHILADGAEPRRGGKPLPREAALARMDDLRIVMEAAYDLRDTAASPNVS